MHRAFQGTGKKPIRSSLCISLLLMLVAGTPVHAQTVTAAAQAAASVAIEGKPADPARDAALLHMVRALNFYPAFKQVLKLQFGGEDYPGFDHFIEEIYPEPWTTQYLADYYGTSLSSASAQQIDEAARYFGTPEGKRVAVVMAHLIAEGKFFNPSMKDVPHADRAVLDRFAHTSTGELFIKASTRTSQSASSIIGGKLVADRLTQALDEAQSRYADMSDSAFRLEMDSLHAGKGNEGGLEQLAMLKEYNERNARQLVTAFAELAPVMRRIGVLNPADLMSNDAIAQKRQDLQVADDTYVRANEGLQMLGQYTMECVEMLSVPETLKKLWRDSVGGQYKSSTDAISRMTAAVLELTAGTRALLDVAEAHAADMTINAEGKLQFAKQEELTAYRTAAERVDQARAKLAAASHKTKS